MLDTCPRAHRQQGQRRNAPFTLDKHGGRSKPLGRPAPHGRHGAGNAAAADGGTGAPLTPNRDANAAAGTAGGADGAPAAARRKPCDYNQRAGSAQAASETARSLSRDLTISGSQRLGIPAQRTADQQLRKVRPRRPSPAEEGQSPAVPKPNRRLPASALESLEVHGPAQALDDGVAGAHRWKRTLCGCALALISCAAAALTRWPKSSTLPSSSASWSRPFTGTRSSCQTRYCQPCRQRRRSASANPLTQGPPQHRGTPPQALYCELDDGASVFFFHDGSLVCWQASESQVERCLFDVRMAQSEPYPADLVETEEMNFVHKPEG